MAFLQPETTYLTEEEAIEYLTVEEEPEETYEAGWYARLSAPGYLDCTDWMGPYETEEIALQELMEFYEVDENGDEIPYE